LQQARSASVHAAIKSIFSHKIFTGAAVYEQPKLLARMAWSQGFYQSNGILRKKNMTGNNIFKKSP